MDIIPYKTAFLYVPAKGKTHIDRQIKRFSWLQCYVISRQYNACAEINFQKSEPSEKKLY